MSEEREATQAMINAYRDACESEQRVVKLADFEAGWQAARQSAGATEFSQEAMKDLFEFQELTGCDKPDEYRKKIAGATGQEPVAWVCEKAETLVFGGWDKRPFSKQYRPVFYAAPIGDNGAKPAMTAPSIAVDPSAPPLTLSPIAQPAESKRVELTDYDLLLLWDQSTDDVTSKGNVSVEGNFSPWILAYGRALLARALAKDQ